MTMKEIEAEHAKKTTVYETAKQIRRMIDDLVKADPDGEVETEITRLVFED